MNLWNLLTGEEYARLCECESLKEDILPIARCYMVNRHMSADDAIVKTLEHLDCNNQYFNLTRDEWDKMVIALSKFTIYAE